MMTPQELDADLAARELEILPHRMRLEQTLGRVLTADEQSAHRIGYLDGKSAGLNAALDQLTKAGL